MMYLFIGHPGFFIIQDFGDGGAYPEIHVAQYPLMMGKQKTSSNALTTTLDAEGKIRYDIIAKQGHGKDKVCFVRLFTPLVPTLIILKKILEVISLICRCPHQNQTHLCITMSVKSV